MYSADFKDAIAALREKLRAAPDKGEAWRARVTGEGEVALSALEFLFDHLVQFEQATAAVHLAARCIPALLITKPRAQELISRALDMARAMGSCEVEVERLKEGKGYSLAEWVARNPAMLQHRGAYWLRAVRLADAQHCIEYGCAAGPNTLHLARLEPKRRWCGVDVSPVLVRQAREMAEQLKIHAGFFTDPWAPLLGSADTVAVLDVLEHTAHADEVLACAERYCKLGGIMVVTMPLGPWNLGPELEVGPGLAGGHVNVTSLQQFSGFISRRGEILDLEVQPGPMPEQPNLSVCATYRLGAGKPAVLVI